MKIKHVIIVIALALGVSSCVVSKKKYEALSTAKRYADRKVRNLLKEKTHLQSELEDKNDRISKLQANLRTLKEEFNNFKYDMSASNAKKSSEIDNLSKKLNNTLKDKQNIKEKTQELEGDLNWLRKQRQMNTEKIDTLTATIRGLERELASVTAAKSASASSLQIAEQKITDLTSKVNATQELLNREKAKNLKLQKQLANQPRKRPKKQVKKEKVPEI